MLNRRFYGLGKMLEKLLVRIVILCAVVLVVAQSFMVTDPMSRVIGYVDLGDVAVSPNASQNIILGEPTITLHLKDYPSLPKMHVLVNGESVGAFDNRYLTFQVQNGDLIQLDATFYNHPVEVQVVTASEQIVSPTTGETFTATGILSLGKAKIDDSR